MIPSPLQDNLTALKHGYYSRSFSRSENQRLEQDLLGGFQDEENLLRVLIDRAASSMDLADMTSSQVQASVRAICCAIGASKASTVPARPSMIIRPPSSRPWNS